MLPLKSAVQILYPGLTLLWIALTVLPALRAQTPSTDTPPPQPPQLEPASNEPVEAIAQFKYPPSLVCEVFAAEPDVANIVALHRDFQGRVFACETFRQERGVEDNRNHGHWMDEELAAQTVQDRIDYIRKYIPDADRKYTQHDDRIRLLVDQDGDGHADRSTVFSDRYNALEMGTGAGVLSYRDRVYYTCIPDLFLLQDADGDGVAEQRKSLHSGFGVRFAFRGHDMHGLIVGPDGRLYFSIGDRGYHIDREIQDPTSGAVFRCELDGSHLEVVHTGLRNPQELAFDDFGNLFTGDNNSDSGDRAQFTEILRGADSGWRMYYQYLDDRGPFNREKIWYPYNTTTPAYILPPIANFADGPSGLEYYPGTGFGDRFSGRFFLCDFRGQAANSGIRSFRHQPAGAGWKLVDQDGQPFWNLLATDLDFGSDGKLYVADWVFGWQGVNKGRIYTFHDPQQIDSEVVQQVQQLLRDGLADQTADQLITLLGHPDRRVRQESQFELVRRNDGGTLAQVAGDSSAPQLARVHAIWGLGQHLRLADANALTPEKLSPAQVSAWLADPDPQVAIAACRLTTELSDVWREPVADLLQHDQARVQFEAAMALSRIGTVAELPRLAQLLVQNDDRDPTLRHGAIMALAGIFGRSTSPAASDVVGLAAHENASVRLATVVAMRKLLQSHRNGTYQAKQVAAKVVADRLQDSEPSVVLEAARVIHDVPVTSQMAALAQRLDSPNTMAASDPLLRRAINANFRVGTRAAAQRLASVAADDLIPEPRRIDAIAALRQWANPPARDAVLNDWRPMSPNRRNVVDARDALQDQFTELMQASDAVANATIDAAGRLKLTSIESELLRVAQSTTARDSMRVAALLSLDRLDEPQLDAVLDELAGTANSLPESLALVVAEILSRRQPETAVPLLKGIVDGDNLPSRQRAIAALGQMDNAGSKQILRQCLAQMQRNELPPELRLDVLLAVEARDDEPLRRLARNYVATRSATLDAKLQPYADTMVGGDAQRGRQIFFGKTEVSCVRCHQVGDTGGAVGPNLSGIGLTRDRKYLLESIVDPNRAIAEGFRQTKVLTSGGFLHTGLVIRDNDQELVLLDADAKEIVISQDEIEDTLPGQSSMPDDLHRQLTRSELRDLVAFLAARKSPVKSGNGEHGEGTEANESR